MQTSSHEGGVAHLSVTLCSMGVVVCQVDHFERSANAPKCYPVFHSTTMLYTTFHRVVVGALRTAARTLRKVWTLLCGESSKISSLAVAASAPMKAENHGLAMFNTVYECLHKVCSVLCDTTASAGRAICGYCFMMRPSGVVAGDEDVA